jgi:hypothetical protein
MSNKNDGYTDDLGELDGLGRTVIDFLPPPEVLAGNDRAVKVTLMLAEDSVEFFKRQAAKYDVPYQRLIRNVVSGYARRYAE